MNYVEGLENHTPLTRDAFATVLADWFGDYKEYNKCDESQKDSILCNFYGLYSALVNKRDVFAICCKEPKNLDSGYHHFSVYYITEEGRASRFWISDEAFAKKLGAKVNKNRSAWLPYITWVSGAIGMSRLLDATDSLFTALKRISGIYTQIEEKM